MLRLCCTLVLVDQCKVPDFSTLKKAFWLISLPALIR